jgi:PleD family two-component response regulator
VEEAGIRGNREENGMKILIAEDDAVSRKILGAMLERLGHEVIEATNGREAWDLFNGNPVRVVVSDWVMPEQDGLALCQKIRDRERTEYTYFILLSGMMTSKEDYRRAMDQGVDDFLTKPLDHDAIWMRLRVAERILNLTSQVQQLEGLINICSYCKRIRQDNNVYEMIEEYIEKHSQAVFSHGICPECALKHFPQKAVSDRT